MTATRSLFAPGRWLLGLIRHRPGRAVLGLVAAHLALWTLLPAMTFTAAPLDVVEGYLWGHEWQLGYHKHPPLAPWLLEAFLTVFGGDWSAYLLSQTAVVVTFWAVWTLARPMVGAPAAALSVLALDLGFYFTIPTIEFNPNVLQMPLWALASLHFHRLLTVGRPRHAALLGLWMGLLVYTKYSAVILALSFLVVALGTGPGRRALRSPALYGAAALAVAIAAPHLYWIVASDFLPFAYALDQKIAGDLPTRLYFPANFLAAQLAAHAVLGLVAALVWAMNRWRPAAAALAIPVDPVHGFDRRYVLIMTLAPLAISMGLCFAMGIEFLTMWGMPMFTLIGLALLVVAKRPSRLALHEGLATAYLALVLLLPVATALGLALAPGLSGKPNRTMWPAAEHAERVTAEWRRHADRPLAVVAGDIWTAGLVGRYGRDRPSVLIAGDLRRSPWIKPDDLARTGLAIVWRVRGGDTEPPAWVRRDYPRRIDLGIFELAPHGRRIAPAAPRPYATIAIAIVPPQDRQSASGGGSSGTPSSSAQ